MNGTCMMLQNIFDVQSIPQPAYLQSATCLFSDGDRPKQIMRRGVLMSMLQQNALTLPLWISKPGEKYVQTLILEVSVGLCVGSIS